MRSDVVPHAFAFGPEHERDFARRQRIGKRGLAFAGEADALLVPDTVIASDQAHKIVLTVGPENKVVPKPVVLGPLSEGLRVIRSGLSPEDKVIVGGSANPMVRPGVAVTPQPGEIKVATTN